MGKLINTIAEIKIRVSRGQGLVNDVKNALIIGTTLKLIFELSVFMTIVLTILCLFGFYFLGALDLARLKLMQKENELISSKYNPHLNKINRLNERFK